MAVFTYQLVFFGWTKLEQDEIRSDRQGTFMSSQPRSTARLYLANSRTAEVSALEAKVKELQDGKQA